MKGLLIKDFINLRKYGKSVLVILVFYIIFSFVMDNIMFLSGMIVLLFSMMAVTSFSYDKLAGWDKYAMSLPLPRRTIVSSKYVLALILAICGMVLSVVAGLILGLFRDTGDITQQLVTSYALFSVGILFLSIMLPLVYKFGVEKSRLMMMLIFAIPVVAVFVLGQTGISVPDETEVTRLIAFSSVVIIPLYAFSWILSYYIYEKKEF